MKKSTQRKKLLAEWSKRNRIRQGNCCQVCGSTKHLNCHHLLPKEKFPEFQFCDWNAIALCVKHHKFGKYSAHSNSIWFAEWMRKNKPVEYQIILQALETTMTSNKS